MLAQPSTTQRPNIRSTIHRPGHTPQIRIMMYSPSTTPIQSACCALCRLRKFFHHPEQRFMHFREIGHFRRPVVHLRIDIDGVLSIPRSQQFMIPDALQSGRLSARLRRGYKQVAPELEHQCHQTRIFSFIEMLDTVRCLFLTGGTNVQRDTSEKFLIGFFMSCKSLVVRALHRFYQKVRCPTRFIGTYIFIIDKIGCCRHINHSSICTFHFYAIIGDIDFTLLRLYLCAGLKTDSSGNTFVRRTMSGQQQAFTILFYLVFFIRSTISGCKIDRTRFICLNTDDQSIIYQRSKYGTGIIHFTYFIPYGCDCPFQI